MTQLSSFAEPKYLSIDRGIDLEVFSRPTYKLDLTLDVIKSSIITCCICVSINFPSLLVLYAQWHDLSHKKHKLFLLHLRYSWLWDFPWICQLHMSKGSTEELNDAYWWRFRRSRYECKVTKFNTNYFVLRISDIYFRYCKFKVFLQDFASAFLIMQKCFTFWNW